MRTRATALLEKGDEFLVMHRFKNDKEYYVLPGGGVEEGESVEEATLRELAEETSIKGEIIKKIFSFHQMLFDMDHEVFLIKHNNEEPKFAPGSIETRVANKGNQYDPKWIKKSKLPDITFMPPEQKELLKKYFNE